MVPGGPPRCYLADLTIVDFAVIDRLQVSFGPGLSVITGETGAGKSIIIDALGAALGDRASSDWVRAGADRAWVEAVFAFPDSIPEVASILAEAGSPLEEGSLFLRREVMPGRSLARFNGRAVASHIVEETATRLVDVHSQGDHVALLRPRVQLDALDRFGRLLELRSQTGEAVRALLAVRRQIQELEEGRKGALREADLLRHEVEEIDGAGLSSSGEEEELATRRLRLKNALRLRSLVTQTHEALTGGHGETGALDLVGEADVALRALRDLDPDAPVSVENLIGVTDTLETLLRGLRAYSELLEDDQSALDEVEERLLLIADLKRKFGPTLEAVLAYREEAAGRLDLLTDVNDRLTQLARNEGELRQGTAEHAGALSTARRAAADDLQRAIQRELADLGMAGTRFNIELRHRTAIDGLSLEGAVTPLAFDETGVDQVEFLIVANPGEPERTIGRVASGGELSRLMLAVKTATAAADLVPVLIFDELDQGVGGRMGHVIGEKLWQLSRDHQVLCVTHLPQVAAYGDTHYVVSKQVIEGRTATTVAPVDGSAREDELALMLGGPRAGEATYEGARELLEAAQEWRRARSDGSR